VITTSGFFTVPATLAEELRVNLGVSRSLCFCYFVKMKSNTKISKQLEKKRNPELVETILAAKKNNSWKRVSEILSGPRKDHIEMNLDAISRQAKEGETLAVPGKVLSVGNIDKKVNVVALGFSRSAEEKILKTGGKVSSILEEIKKNPDAKNIRVLEGVKGR